MNSSVSPAAIASSLEKLWSPRIIGEVDDVYIKVAKVQGTLAWHRHEDEDELFYVLNGHLRIELENENIELSEGEMYIVPKGVRHNPVAEEECHLLLVEKKTTLHTGDVVIARTVPIENQL